MPALSQQKREHLIYSFIVLVLQKHKQETKHAERYNIEIISNY